MQIPLLDLRAQYLSIKKEIDAAVEKVLKDQFFILSEEVSALEDEVAKYTGAVTAAGVASGTDALVLALKASGIEHGDRVITSPFTFFATGEAISLLGAIPMFVDIDPVTYNIAPNKIEELLRDTSGEVKERIKAVLPVHLYGQCADMTGIMSLAREHNLKVIEDCAQAIGALHGGRQAGSFGIAGCLSFFPSKNLGGFGDGGMIVSSDSVLIEHIKRLRVHGSKEQYIHEEIGYNSRLDSLQAAVLRIKLKKLNEWLDKRRVNAARYDEAFLPVGIAVPKVAEGNTHTYHQYTIAVDDRDELLRYLNDKGIAARVYYPVPLHLQPCYRSLGYSIGTFPVAEEMAEKVISLPVYPELTEEEIDYIIQTVKSFFES